MKTALLVLLAFSVTFAGCVDSLESWRGALSLRARPLTPLENQTSDQGAIPFINPQTVANRVGAAAFQTPQACIDAATRASPSFLTQELANFWIVSCSQQAARASLNETYCLSIQTLNSSDSRAQLVTCVMLVARDARRPTACDILDGQARKDCWLAAAPGHVFETPEIQ